MEPEEHSGCSPFTECIDPGIYDTNLDGNFSSQELQDFCDIKCNPGWSGEDSPYPAWNPPIGNNKLLWACWASPASNIVNTNSCYPYTPSNYAGGFDVIPEYEATFTSSSSSGSSVELYIASNIVNPAFVLDVEFALDQCDSQGVNGGTCRIVLTTFNFTTTSAFSSGDYDVLEAQFVLSGRHAAEVSFASCSNDECEGTFEFSTALSNAIALDVHWTQENTSTSKIDDAALHLGNDGNSLGGVEALGGILTLDPTADHGTLRLIGEGSDSLGGTFASLSFDIEGSVTPR